MAGRLGAPHPRAGTARPELGTWGQAQLGLDRATESCYLVVVSSRAFAGRADRDEGRPSAHLTGGADGPAASCECLTWDEHLSVCLSAYGPPRDGAGLVADEDPMQAYLSDVQLPSPGGPDADPAGAAQAALREARMLLRRVPAPPPNDEPAWPEERLALRAALVAAVEDLSR